jgi:predicted CXXCH cytochrome family protein
MDSTRTGRAGEFFRCLAAVMGIAVGGVATAAEHPTLVDPENTSCTTCHDEVLAVRVPHVPAVDDCLTCHLFDDREGQMGVELSATGTELCLACHDDLAGAAAGEMVAPHAPVIDDCGNCHDPHGTDDDAMLSVELGLLCGQCHDSRETDANHPLPVSRADCGSCHEAHGSNNTHMFRGSSQHTPFEEGSCEACHRRPRGTRVRLNQEGGALCEACHGDVADEVGAEVHTAVRQGRCVECHEPHLAAQTHLLRAEGGDLCYPCHPEIEERATGPGAHPALEDGCDNCHHAHHSDRRSMLLDEPDELCRACHDASDPDLQKRHFQADMATTRCGSCHDPHGSRSMPLIANGSIHAPFREGCSNCHDGSAGRLVEDGNALCVTCHDDVADAVATATVPHAAMEMAECIDCHSPHASRRQKLLRSSGEGICTSCHEEQAGGEGETVHRAISWIGCHSCHLPHGGAEEHLLRASGNDLCVGCHVGSRVEVDANGVVRLDGGYVLRGERARGLKVIDLDPFGRENHPIPGHPVSGVIDGKGRSEVAKSLVGREMSCRLCHEPHAAASAQLFTWKAKTQTELCIACHPK